HRVARAHRRRAVGEPREHAHALLEVDHHQRERKPLAQRRVRGAMAARVAEDDAAARGRLEREAVAAAADAAAAQREVPGAARGAALQQQLAAPRGLEERRRALVGLEQRRRSAHAASGESTSVAWWDSTPPLPETTMQRLS